MKKKKQGVDCTGFVNSPLLLPNGGLTEKQTKSKTKAKKQKHGFLLTFTFLYQDAFMGMLTFSLRMQ